MVRDWSERRLSLQSHKELQLLKKITVFGVSYEPQSTLNKQVCVGGHHVAVSHNSILHLRILFHSVVPRVLLLCETKFSLKEGGEKVHA